MEPLEETDPPLQWRTRRESPTRLVLSRPERAALVDAVVEELEPPEEVADEVAPKKSRAVPAPKHRNVCFTAWGHDNDEWSPRHLDFIHPSWTNVRYCVYQLEVCPETSRLHLQGYIEFTSAKTYSSIHGMAGLETAHLEPRQASAKIADHYCRKPVEGCVCNICCKELLKPSKIEGPWEFGQMSHPGQRSDLLEVRMHIEKGLPMKRIAKEYFPEWVRFGKQFKEYRRITAERRDFKPFVMLCVGPAGQGKSRFLHRLAHFLSPPDQDYFVVPDKTTGTLWCDDYDQEDVFMMDEADGSRFRPGFFNGLVDRYQFVVPAHGHAGSQLTAHYMLFGSNYLPKFWWKNRSEKQLKQTMRRIDVIVPFFNRVRPLVHQAHGVFAPIVEPQLPCNHCDKCEPCCLCGEMDSLSDEIQDWELIGD